MLGDNFCPQFTPLSVLLVEPTVLSAAIFAKGEVLCLNDVLVLDSRDLASHSRR